MSPKRVPLELCEKVLSLYQERYYDLNIRHFHEKLREEHGIELSYTCVQKALQGQAWLPSEPNMEHIAEDGCGGPCPACCCKWIAASFAGFRTVSAMT